jgi:hypothetical protein
MLTESVGPDAPPWVLMHRPGQVALTAALIAVVVGCAAPPVQLPSNVAVTRGAHGEAYIDKVDFSYRSQNQRDFAKLKLCVAENVSNNAVGLRDSAGSFVGAASRTYYQTNNTQSVGGSGVFKYVDDSQSTLIANGTTVSGDNSAILSKDFVRFELKAGVSGNDVALMFYAITRAQQNTGSLANDGFGPVVVAWGARAPDVYASIEAVASKVKACLN